MLEFCIHVPTHDNSGQDMTINLALFEQKLFDLFGGFHRENPVQGAWRDNGKDYRETMVPFKFAAENAMSSALIAAKQCFPDQVAFYIVQTGTAQIVYADTI